MKANTTDLQDAEAPEHVARILRNAAQHYYESSSELACRETMESYCA